MCGEQREKADPRGRRGWLGLTGRTAHADDIKGGGRLRKGLYICILLNPKQNTPPLMYAYVY